MYRSKYYNVELDQELGILLTIDNLVERGYSLADIREMGFPIPEFDVLTRLQLAGVIEGKDRYERRKIKDASK